MDYSLAKRTETGLQLHRLVQGVIRARHPQHACGPAWTGSIMTADTPVSREPADPLAVVLGLLAADAPGG